MLHRKHRTQVALFVALTRAVREAELPCEVRVLAFDVIDRLARSVGQSGFPVELDALDDLASRDERLHSSLRPLRDELRALALPP